MNKTQVKQILSSIGITLAVSFVFAVIVHYFYNIGFWFLFAYGILGQFVLFFLFGAFLEQIITNRTIRKASAEQTARIEAAIRDQSISIECAYCNTINIVPLIVSQENIFKCFSCQQDNGIQLKYFAARVTNPVATKVEVELMEHGFSDEVMKAKIQEREEAIKKIEKEKNESTTSNS